MPRPFPWKCRTCGEIKLKPTEVDYPVEMEHDGRAYSLFLPRLGILECESCKTRILPDEALARITCALRKEAGLLLPDEIRSHRKAVHLTQEQLAAFLKVSEITVSRWETGGQIQQRAMDLLLRLFFAVPAARQYLMSGASPSIEIHKIVTEPPAPNPGQPA